MNKRRRFKKKFNGGHLRNLKKFFRILASISSTIIFLLVIIFLFKGAVLKINDISCTKTKGECSEQEKLIINDFSGENIFLLNKTEVKREIKASLPKIGFVEVDKQLFNKLRVKLIPREPLFSCTKSNKTWYVVDKERMVFEQQIDEPEEIPVFNIKNGQLIVGEKLAEEYQSLVDLALELKESYIIPDKIDYEQNLFTLDLKDNTTASISGSKSLTSQVGSLQFILRQSKIEGRLPKSIDLRFSKPIVKY
jgi:cell division septal protein FtsQ